jgi:NAD(P)H-nitrite reductase large subunit
MQPDDEVCLCFHVTLRKLQQFLQQQRIQRASQLSECFGAGTGCGWCRPLLQRLAKSAADVTASNLPAPADYARERAAYIRAGKGTPPPA